jgi:hypothetical protein
MSCDGKDEPARSARNYRQSTVKSHVISIFGKFGVSTRVEAAIVGWETFPMLRALAVIALCAWFALSRFGVSPTTEPTHAEGKLSVVEGFKPACTCDQSCTPG